jgi:hypothetical protein
LADLCRSFKNEAPQDLPQYSGTLRAEQISPQESLLAAGSLERPLSESGCSTAAGLAIVALETAHASMRSGNTRPYQGLPDIDYPFHDKVIVVTRCGRICLGNKKINFSQVFAGQAVGIKEVHDDIWLVTFMDYDLGYFDLETRVLEPLENPFGPRVLPM